MRDWAEKMAIRAFERSAVLVVKKREKEATLQLKLKRSTEVCPSGTTPLPAVGALWCRVGVVVMNMWG